MRAGNIRKHAPTLSKRPFLIVRAIYILNAASVKSATRHSDRILNRDMIRLP